MRNRHNRTVFSELFGQVCRSVGLGADDCVTWLDPSPPPHCPRNVEGTFSPALQVSFPRWLPPNILLHFYCPNSFHPPFSGNTRNLVKRLLRPKLYFLWGSKVYVTTSTVRFQTCFEFNPLLQDLVLSSCCMIRGAGGMRKC